MKALSRFIAGPATRPPYSVPRIGKLFVCNLILGSVVVLTPRLFGDLPHVPGRLLVKPKLGFNDNDTLQLFAELNAQEVDQIPQVNVRILQVPESREALVLQALTHNPNIEFAEPDHIYDPALVPNDTYYSCCAWHLPKLQCPQAWDITTGKSSVVIAVLDTGVQMDHPDLIANLIPGWNFYDNNSNTSDVLGHGTQVAGVAAAVSNNGTGVTGIAWLCKIMPIRISDSTGSASISTMAKALTWVADQGVRVANISYPVSGNSTLTSSAQYFQSRGGVITIAAGNDGVFTTNPDDPYVLTVSAINNADTIETWSNTGNNIDLAAPNGIPTTGIGGKYVTGGGTSIAAPVVAGVAALVLSANPALSGTQVQGILKNNADPLGAAGWDPQYGYGRVNAYKAVLAATGGGADMIAPTARITSPTGGATLSGTALVGVSASDNLGVTKVQVYINGALSFSSTSAAPSFSWDTTKWANGSYSLVARAYDAAGNYGTSSSITVSVNNVVADTSAPSVQITSPANGATVSGTILVNISTLDNIGVIRVECYLDGRLVASASAASLSYSWNTTTVLNGSHTIQAKAYDAANNSTSASISVSAANTTADTTAPNVRITSPTNGAKVSGWTTVSVSATDNLLVTNVSLYIDQVLFASSSSASAAFSWPTSKVSKGAHTLQARGRDAAGNTGYSATLTVYK